MRGKNVAPLALVAIVLTTITGAAIWAPMTMTQLVENSELIVVGELTSIEESPAAGDPAAGTIQVQDVLRGPAAEQKVTSVRLILPSRTRRMASDAVMYPQGQRGIWLLRRDPATGGYLADNPQRLKPMSELADVRAFLKTVPPR